MVLFDEVSQLKHNVVALLLRTIPLTLHVKRLLTLIPLTDSTDRNEFL